jgi:hypothetical protein
MRPGWPPQIVQNFAEEASLFNEDLREVLSATMRTYSSTRWSSEPTGAMPTTGRSRSPPSGLDSTETTTGGEEAGARLSMPHDRG